MENIIWNFSVCANDESRAFVVDYDCLRTVRRILSEDAATSNLTENSTYLEILCACTKKRSRLFFLCLEEQLRIQPDPHIFDPLIQDVIYTKGTDTKIQGELKSMLERILKADVCEMTTSTKVWAKDLLDSIPSFVGSKPERGEKENCCISVDEAVRDLLANPFALRDLSFKICTKEVEKGSNLLLYGAIFPDVAEAIRLHCTRQDKCLHAEEAQEGDRADMLLSGCLSKMLKTFCGTSIALVSLYKTTKVKSNEIDEKLWFWLESIVRSWGSVDTGPEKRLLLVDLEIIITKCNKNLLPNASAQLVCILFGSLLHFASDQTHGTQTLEDAAYALHCWIISIKHGCTSMAFMSVLLMSRFVREIKPWFLQSHCLLKYLKEEIAKLKQVDSFALQDVKDVLVQIESELE